LNDFASRLLAWHAKHGRHDLPWQQPRDAYRIWVSEIMLQQTQVQTVIPYFERFIGRFPDVTVLAAADLDEVLHHWSGLGYYARARNLHRAAVEIATRHDGIFPDDYDIVVGLPGIGRSTAGAILALAFGQCHAILDGNAKRVLARHEAIAGWPGETAVAKQLWEAAERHTPAEEPAAYTQAIMDLGATLCTRGNPACGRCPVRADCAACADGSVGDYPGRARKKAKPLRTTTMVIARLDGHVYLERRPESGIWGGLWSLPELGSDDVTTWCRRRLQAEVVDVETWQLLRHGFTHYDLDIRPIAVRVAAPASKVADGDAAAWYRPGETPPGGIAAPVSTLLSKLGTEQHVSED